MKVRVLFCDRVAPISRQLSMSNMVSLMSFVAQCLDRLDFK